MPLRFAFHLFKHGSLWAYRLLTFAVLAGGLVFAASVLFLRYWMLPHVEEYRDLIVYGIARAANQRIQIGRIEGEWDGFRPRLILRDVRLLDATGQERLKLEEVDSTLAWLSLFSGELRFHSIEVEQLSLEVRRDVAGNLSVAGIPVGSSGGDSGGLGDWLLLQHRIVLRDSEFTWIDERLGGVPLELEDVEVLVEQGFWHHRFGLRAKPPIDVAAPIDIRGDLRGRSFGDPSGWSGRVYLEIAYADLAALRQWVELPMQTTQGSGSLQIWGTLQRGRPLDMTADVVLSNVHTRMDPEVPELQLTNLRGRLGWRSEGREVEMWARGLTFSSPDGVRLPPADISYSYTLPEGDGPLDSEIAFDALDLEAVVRLVDRLPVDPALRSRLAEAAPRGLLRDFHIRWKDHFSWNGPYTVRGGFQDIALSPSGPVPGVSHLTGSVSSSEAGGSLTAKGAATTLNLPSVFVEPVPFDTFDARMSWTMSGGLPKVTLERVAVSNKDLSGEFAGRYDAVSGGPGRIDIKGNLERASGTSASRYVPVSVPQPLRDWLQRAIVSGRVHKAQFTLRGDLRHFPWGHGGDGLFEVVAPVSDGTLAYAPGWPRVERLAGQIAIRGNRLEITGTGGALFGASLLGFTAVVPDLGSSAPVLQVRGEADGPTSDFLRYLRESPIREQTGSFIDGMRVSGRGRLSLNVDMQLHKSSDARISGVFAFADNTLDPGEGLPLLEQLSGKLVFDNEDVSLKDGATRVFGAPAKFTITRAGAGAVNIQATGQVDAALLRRQINQPQLAKLSGSTDWRLNATVRDRRHDFVLESDLFGLASSLPPPFNKSVAERFPLRIERRERATGPDLVSFTYADLASGQFLLDRAAKTRISRGEIMLGGSAPSPQRDGVWVAGRMERFDLDRWQELVLHTNAGGGGSGLAGIELSAAEVRAFSRDFHDVQVVATRREGAWAAKLDSREVTGEVNWLPDGNGMLVGRFSRMALPSATSEVEPAGARPGEGRDLPSVDVTVDDFQMGKRQFGKLALTAVPRGADWHIERLELASPDGTLALTGLWQAWTVNARTQIDVKLAATDVGRFLARMDLPQGIQGGTAKLEGPLSWAGPPYALDLPTLSGQLSLKASKGRFVKIDPGIGKLLAVVNLQTLPKMVTLDLRDIFREGFAFDQIAGNVEIARGVARTKNFGMEGPAARVEMTGEVNLAGETQKLDVRIFPALSDSVALGTAFVNPAVGLGTWVLQKALRDPIGQMLSYEYHVAGTWNTPTVTKKRREIKEQAPAGRR